jgi:putative acetyltransferase
MNPAEIRTIQPADNMILASIVRDSLAEFGANKPGTVFYDPTTDHLFELFQSPGAVYYVLIIDGEVLGGAGIYPSPGLPQSTCELVKMYLRPAARGQGYGKLLMKNALTFRKLAATARFTLKPCRN